MMRKNVAHATTTAKRWRPLDIFKLPISNCQIDLRLPRRPINRQLAIGNRQCSSLLMQHRKFYRFEHRQRTRLTTQLCRSAEREVSFGRAARGNRYFHCLFSSVCAAFMPGDDRVLARRHALDGEAAIFRGYCKEWMLRHANVRLHPWMKSYVGVSKHPDRKSTRLNSSHRT